MQHGFRNPFVKGKTNDKNRDSPNQRRESKPMQNQDTVTIIITFLLLLPWLGRTAASAIAVWRAHTERHNFDSKKPNR